MAFKAVLTAAPIEAKIHAASLGKGEVINLLDSALAQGIINTTEAELIRTAEHARMATIHVDDFSGDEMLGR